MSTHMPGDALPLLDEPKAGRLTIQYGPTADTDVTENPPRFTWLPVIDDDARYVVRVSTDPAFPEKATTVYQDVPLNFYTHDAVFEPGEYHWSYATWDTNAAAPSSAWSSTRSFTLAAGIAQTPLPSRADRLTKSSMARPRLWMTQDRLGDFKAAVAKDPSHCTWSTFYEKSVLPWMRSRQLGPDGSHVPRVHG